MDQSKYVSLHNHTSFSIGQGLTTPKELFEKAKELGQTAVAVTDNDSMAGMWDSLKAYKSTGVKLIAGCEFNFLEDLSDPENKTFNKLVLLARNHTGYKNLLTISKLGYDNMVLLFKKECSRIDWKILEEHSEGLICLSGDGNGFIPQLIMQDRFDEAVRNAQRFKKIFGEYFALELQPHNLQIRANPYSGNVDQRKINLGLKKIHDEHGIQCVVATGLYYEDKEHYETHDVLLSISSGQPVYSGQRLKFDKNDFYIKSEQEVRSYFERHKKTWSQEFVDSMIDVSAKLADSCENPDWVDPKFSNPDGKELPEFPVKEQPDYSEFLKWKSEKSDVEPEEDVAYLRFICEKRIESNSFFSEDKGYIDRFNKELDVFRDRGAAGYMLIVWDYVNWAKNNGVPVGPGRGCLTKESLVFTERGFKQLSDVKVNDYVYSHSGSLKKVNNKFVYNISESGLEINTNYSFEPIKLTSDHKCFASKAIETEQYIRLKKAKSPSFTKVKRWEKPKDPKWYKVSDLSEGDFIFMPFPTRSTSSFEDVDLTQFISDDFYTIENNFIKQKIPLNNELSQKSVVQKTKLFRSAVRNAKNNGVTLKESTAKKVSNYLDSVGSSLNDWMSDENVRIVSVTKTIPFNEEFMYFLGRWVGDGWIRYNTDAYCYQTGVAFHKYDERGVARIESFLNNLGMTTSRRYSKKRKLVQLLCNCRLLYNLLKSYVPDYKQTSGTKHFPSFFRKLDDSLLKSMLLGLFDSDGHLEVLHKNGTRENIDTTSLRLALEVKEALLYLKIPSSIGVRKPYTHSTQGYQCAQSYKVRFKGLSCEGSSSQLVRDNGYFCPITSIESTKLTEVYDISVPGDKSYVTSNYAVHNSVGGSLVAYLLGIHEADPIKYGLLFERFYNKLKTSYSDIDLDFATSKRDKVLHYLVNKYGSDKVAGISNFNRITPKVYARDIARSCELGGDRAESVQIGNDIADSISTEVSSIKSALESPLFAEYAKVYPELEKFSKICKYPRALGTHAAGIVIGKRPLHEYVPVRRDKKGDLVLANEKEAAEDAGNVKFDLLGLSTLDVIGDTIEIVKETKGIDVEVDLEEYDKETYDLISRGDTFCVFQFGTSSTTMNLCKSMKPKNIEDLALITTLARPASEEFRDEFFKVRNGESTKELMHPSLEKAFEQTLGFPMYDESLLILADSVAHWNYSEADKLRKLTKDKGKNPAKVAKWREEFADDAFNKKNIDKEMAYKIWDEIIEPFGKYSFNKSHAVLYSLISYYTAYLKCHYYLPFMLSNLKLKVKSNSPKAKDEVIKIKQEIRASGVKIEPPHLDKSDISYKIIDDKTLMTGLDSLRGVKEGAIEDIIQKRPFKNFKDLVFRTDTTKVRSPVIQALAASGALDHFGLSREHMFYYCSDFRKKMQALRTSLDKKVKANKMTQEEADAEFDAFEYPFPEDEKKWPIHQVFALEEHFMGEGISGTLQERFPRFFDKNIVNFDNLSKKVNYVHVSNDEKENRKANTYPLEYLGANSLKGVIVKMHETKVKKEDSVIFGQIMCFLTIEDPFGNHMDVICFPDPWQRAKDRVERELSGGKGLIEPGIAICVKGAFQLKDNTSYSCILTDILSYKEHPKLPRSLKSKTVRMQKKSKVNKKDVSSLRKEELAQAIEDDLVFDGVSDLDDDFNFT